VVYAWILSFGFYAVYTFFLLRYPETMFGFFLKDNPEFPGLREEVLALAPLFARTIVWQFPGLVIMRGTNGFINGIGHTRLSLLFGLFDGVVLRIGCSWFLGDVVGLGLQGYILGFAVACYGTGIPSLVYFFFFPWEKRKAVTVLEG
jgi:Na+-driven multidrug efflux pump